MGFGDNAPSGGSEGPTVRPMCNIKKMDCLILTTNFDKFDFLKIRPLIVKRPFDNRFSH